MLFMTSSYIQHFFFNRRYTGTKITAFVRNAVYSIYRNYWSTL